MVILLTVVHVLVCVFLVIVVLLQSGKAADLAGAFGGMGSQTAFGPRGSATVLSKATTIAAALFMVTSLTLAVAQSRATGGATSVVERSKGAASKSVLERTQAPAPKPNAQVPLNLPGTPAPAAPGTPGAPQPSVTLEDPQTGKSQTIPITIPPQTPENTKQAPAQKK